MNEYYCPHCQMHFRDDSQTPHCPNCGEWFIPSGGVSVEMLHADGNMARVLGVTFAHRHSEQVRFRR